MKKGSFFNSLPFRLLAALAVGICAGLALSAADGSPFTGALLNILVTVKFISSQFISFCVPLIIIGFIAPSITRLGNNASQMLIVALCIAYISSVGAAAFATGAGFSILPFLHISPEVDGLKELPKVLFELSIPQIMPVMSALFFSVLVGLSAAWNGSRLITEILEEFQEIVLSIVTKYGAPVSELVSEIRRYPQVLINVPGPHDNHEKAALIASEPVQQAIREQVSTVVPKLN